MVHFEIRLHLWNTNIDAAAASTARICQDCTKCCDTSYVVGTGSRMQYIVAIIRDSVQKRRVATWNDLKTRVIHARQISPLSSIFCGQTYASKQIFDFSQVTSKQLTFPYVYFAIHFYKAIKRFRTKRFRIIRLLLILFRCASKMRLFVPIQMHQCVIWKTVAHSARVHFMELHWSSGAQQLNKPKIDWCHLFSCLFHSIECRFDFNSFQINGKQCTTCIYHTHSHICVIYVL